MAILLFAVVAFSVMRLVIPQTRSASNLKLATFALPCALAGWLLMSVITNIVLRSNYRGAAVQKFLQAPPSMRPAPRHAVRRLGQPCPEHSAVPRARRA